MDDQATHINVGDALRELDAQWAQLDNLENALIEVRESAFDFAAESIDRALQKLRAFEPSVSVIGQVKAGKSTLLNALIGQPGLLPSDVNPWTSVITALHFNSRRRPPNTRAMFRFFDEFEWDRLVKTGGRLGEMASRAGFEAEARTVREQVTRMREATEKRLGDEFKDLLGSSHIYETLDKDIIDRYICYGDPEDLADGSHEGVYADLTKTADLYLDIPDYPKNLCFRDTPGVNDTFMMREQITLNAISESRACIVVLSAHQALTTMDMALLRIICAVDAREIIIFVNRMDELTDPAAEEARIRASIRKTLSRVGIDDDIEILFGSGYWAQAAIENAVADMAPASLRSLESWAQAHDRALTTAADRKSAARDASGILPLLTAVSQRIVDGPTARILEELRTDIDSIVAMVETVERLRSSKATGTGADPDMIRARLHAMHGDAQEAHEKITASVRSDLEQHLVQAQQAFLETALESLEDHVATYGTAENWTHVPMTLRMSMRTAYMSACNSMERQMTGFLNQAAATVQDILDVDLGLIGAEQPQNTPILPAARAPANLAKTLSLDLGTSWWQRFWKFGQQARLRKRYGDAIINETTPIIEEILSAHFDVHAERVKRYVVDFVDDQAHFLEELLDQFEPATKKSERSVA